MGDVASVQLGKMLSAKSKTGRGGRPYLRNINVRWHAIDVRDVLEMDFDAREVAKYKLLAGDVLVCEGGEPGRAAIWMDQLPGALYQKALHRVRFTDGCVDSRYFVYFLELAAAEGLLAARFTGSTIKHLPREAFLDVVVPIAPVAEQRRIVAVLEEHLSELDAAVAGLERARANARRLMSSVFHAACSGALTGANPLYWNEKSIGALATLVTSGSRGWAQYYSTEGALFVRSQDINTDRLVIDSVARVQPPSKSEGSRTRIATGDILVTITGANVTKAARVEGDLGEAYVSQHVGLIRLQDVSLSDYVHLFLISPSHGRGVLEKAAYGAGKPGLNLEQLRSLIVPVPPPSERRAIVEKVRVVVEEIEKVNRELGIQLLRAARFRQSILKHAFEGKLVPQDPNDEPASALLERIRAERESSQSRAPRTRAKAKSPARPRRR